jgi:putative membrane protein
MNLLLDTLLLRPYVFGFVAAFVAAGAADLGWRRTALFGAWVWPLAWLAEFSSTRTGIPFGLYRYTGTTRGQELYLADVPFMDSLSFTFLAYAAFCLARAALGTRRVPRPVLAAAGGALMMMLDVVIDPLAVRGDRWFLGHIFYYPEGGAYFGVPLSNFAGWWLVGTAAIGGYLALAGDAGGRRVWPGVGLYYAVLAFDLAVTGWIGEPVLLTVGTVIHAGLALVLYAARRGLERPGGPARRVTAGGRAAPAHDGGSG